MRKQKTMVRGSKKKRSRILFVTTIILGLFVGYVVYAIQLPEDHAFENIDQIVQQKELLQYGGDGPQPSSVLANNEINPIASTFERIIPVWKAPVEDFYLVAQKEENQLRLASLMGLVDIVNADLNEVSNRFVNLKTNGQGWSDEQGTAIISDLGDDQYAFYDQPTNAGVSFKGTGFKKSDRLQWDVQNSGVVKRSVFINALATDTFVLQETLSEGAYQGVILMKFSADGSLLCLRKTTDLGQVANINEVTPEGWDQYTDGMETVFSIAGGKVTFAETIFE